MILMLSSLGKYFIFLRDISIQLSGVFREDHWSVSDPPYSYFHTIAANKQHHEPNKIFIILCYGDI